MGRKPAPQPLTLPESNPVASSTSNDQQQRIAPAETLQVNLSPADSRSPRSPKSPRSPFRFHNKKSPSSSTSPSATQAQHLQHQQQDQQPQSWRPSDEHPYPPISSALEQVPSQNPTEKRGDASDWPNSQDNGRNNNATTNKASRHQHKSSQQSLRSQHQRHGEDKSSKSGFFFNFGKSGKSTDRLASHQKSESRADTMSRGSDNSTVTKQNSKQSESTPADSSSAIHRTDNSLPSKSSTSLASSVDNESSSGKKGKPKPFALLGRSRSQRERDREGQLSPKDKEKEQPTSAKQPEIEKPERAYTAGGQHPLRTTPGQPDRSFRDMMSSSSRNQSAERSDRSRTRDAHGRDKENQNQNHRDNHRDNHFKVQSSTGHNQNTSGSAFFSGLKSSGSKAADMISKGLFGKGGRSSSTTEKEPVVDDEHYQLKVLNLPLREQVRRTRISKRLEDSRDKTEFWMPAFPWRAIDYLNYKGTEVEGLYRVPGSGPQIKKWQRKFDEEHDVDLFAQDDLYDINIIGSMLKAWLRQLPDELFPKQAQERIARECAGSETVPQMLVDELSNLSPFNYYLLFAITCHLSLLLAHSDKNKMDFRNLCICFQPCMKIDAFCFKFLVCDWRDCWKGCKDEARYIEEEYMLFDQPPPRGLSEQRRRLEESPMENRTASSSETASQSNRTEKQQPQQPKQQKEQPKQQTKEQTTRSRKKTPQQENDDASDSTISTTLTIDSKQETPPRQQGDNMRPLSPIKPLSPLGF
ncbi:hypothetical protein MGG_09303 [Pyricularia oryzae 70-15]|uniref:Rho-GAP domain-containing protein n=1 Tax=Pyricularia oryzae (strain 70-15 / ATCC MYA-4617 / FGSC 8958) TaxID=242507 RepID=G4MQQ3_PYRO7|nr:uncharacterized protein MGG_09303 [Pyricularia oryzae 70-15]EHA57340.1 hypothetical protein MGG_09303 [Pyricularia oryzae 70-15]KAI7923204.1 hypothetical protein M9X92_004480 [Pyricularia oryzae]KAI7924145.1 hypothetical protein M0657_004816 [Pyricularia oryzae]